MKIKTFTLRIAAIVLLAFLIAIPCEILSQSDGTTVEETKKEKKDKKRKDEFKVYGGVSLNNLVVSDDQFKSNLGIGWMLGGAYKRGKFFYWEVGLRYNSASYDLTPDTTSNFDGSFSVSNIDVPLTVGVNFLSFASRIVGLRLFLGVTPEFALGISGNDIGGKDDINTFNLLGHGGLGVDVAFLYLETGVNYGFVDLFKDDIKSNPLQLFVCLGFRF